MRIARFIILSAVIFFILLTSLSLFFPSHVRVSRAVDIAAPRSHIHSLIADPLLWKSWIPGAETSTPVYRGGVIKGIRMATGQLLEIKSITDSTVQILGTKSSSIEAAGGWNILGKEEGSYCTVQWYMDFEFDWYPWEKFASLLLESRYGYYLEKGLQELKAHGEQQP